MEKLTPAEAAALLSALVFQEKNASAPDYDALPVNLQDSITLANTLAIRAEDIQRDFGLPVIGDDYCAENLKFGLSEVVYRWAMMDSFSEVLPINGCTGRHDSKNHHALKRNVSRREKCRPNHRRREFISKNGRCNGLNQKRHRL